MSKDEKGRILIVGSVESTGKTVPLMFRKSGYATEVAGTGREAMEKARSQFFNVALVDVELPDMNGVELLATLREINPDMAMVVVTGCPSLETAVQALNNGAAAYITKPLNMGDMLATVEGALDKQRVAVESRRLYQQAQRELAESRRAEEALRECSKRLEEMLEQRTKGLRDAREYAESIVAAVREPLLVLDEDLRVVSANRSFYRTFKITPKETEGQPMYELGNRQWDIPRLRELLEEVLPKNKAFEDFEVEHDYPTIGRRTMLLSARREREASETQMILLTIEDITERKLAEERVHVFQRRLRSMASQLSLAEERERKRLAAGLHDQVGQPLAAVKIKLGALRGLLSSDGLSEQVDEIRELVETAIHEMRSLTFELSPPILYDLGLDAALQWLVEQVQAQHGIVCKFEDDNQPKPLGDDARGLLFWVVRELLINVVKHAKARTATVSICRDDDELRVSVEDDGVGFDTSEIDRRNRGFGLFSIRQLLTEFGGQVEVESKPGQGTRVTLVAPLECGEESDQGH